MKKPPNGQPPTPRRPGRPRPPQPPAPPQWQMTPPRRAPVRGPGPGARQPPPPEPIDGVFDPMGMGMDLGPDETARISEWLEDVYGAGPVQRLELQQVAGAGAGCPVRDWAADDLAGVDDVMSIAQDIHSAALEDCESQGSGQFTRYVLIATRASGAANAFRRMFFTVRGADVDQPGWADMGGAESLVAQSQNHTEKFARLALGYATAAGRTLLIQNAELSKQAQAAFAAQAQAALAREQLLDRTQERTFAMRKFEAEQARAEHYRDIKEGVLAWGAIEVSKKFGAEMPPELRGLLFSGVGSSKVGTIMQAVSGSAAAGAKGPVPLQFGGEELEKLSRLVKFSVDALASLDEAVLALIAGRQPPQMQAALRDAHAYATEARARAHSGEPVPTTPEHQRRVAMIAGGIVQFFGSAADAEVGVLLAKMDPPERAEAAEMRTIIKSKLAQPTAMMTNGAASVVSTAASNGHGTGTNGAPAPTGAGGSAP